MYSLHKSHNSLYLYSKDLSNDNPNIKLSLSISIDDVIVNTIDSKLKSQKDDLILWGSYSDPIVKYGEFSSYKPDLSNITTSFESIMNENNSKMIDEYENYNDNYSIEDENEIKQTQQNETLIIGIPQHSKGFTYFDKNMFYFVEFYTKVF